MYVNILPAPVGGSVKIKIFHPARNSEDDPEDAYPDLNLNIGQDDAWGAHHQGWQLWKSPPETPNDYSDDTPVTPPMQTDIDDPRVPNMDWWEFATVPYAEIQNGGLFRVQAFTANSDVDDSGEYNSHSFSIGAFPSWIGDGQVCDVRVTPDTCPTVYGATAISVMSDLRSVGAGGTIDFYFASFDPAYAGQTFDVQLWDPGEGLRRSSSSGPTTPR